MSFQYVFSRKTSTSTTTKTNGPAQTLEELWDWEKEGIFVVLTGQKNDDRLIELMREESGREIEGKKLVNRFRSTHKPRLERFVRALRQEIATLAERGQAQELTLAAGRMWCWTTATSSSSCSRTSAPRATSTSPAAAPPCPKRDCDFWTRQVAASAFACLVVSPYLALLTFGTGPSQLYKDSLRLTTATGFAIVNIISWLRLRCPGVTFSLEFPAGPVEQPGWFAGLTELSGATVYKYSHCKDHLTPFRKNGESGALYAVGGDVLRILPARAPLHEPLRASENARRSLLRGRSDLSLAVRRRPRRRRLSPPRTVSRPFLDVGLEN